jgi:hypothetical protein
MSHKQKQHVSIWREGSCVLCLTVQKGHEKLETNIRKLNNKQLVNIFFFVRSNEER